MRFRVGSAERSFGKVRLRPLYPGRPADPDGQRFCAGLRAWYGQDGRGGWALWAYSRSVWSCATRPRGLAFRPVG